MGILKISTVEQTDSANSAENEITKTLNPLLIFTRIIGIGLYSSSNSGNSYLYSLPKGLKSKVFSVISYFIFLIILAIHVMSMVNLLKAEKKGFLEISSTFLMSRILDQLNHSLRVVGTHICFLILVRRHWTKVWRSINVIGRFKIQLNTKHYKRFRLFSLLGIIFILFVGIVSLSLGYKAAISLWKPTWKEKVIICITQFSTIYSNSSFALFVSLSLVAQIGFDSIARQIRDVQYVLMAQNSSMVEEQIGQWKSQHETVCEYVYHLNRSFGGFLLFEVGCNFAGLITQCFYMLLSLQDNWPKYINALSIIAMFRYSIPLIVICIVCDNIRSQRDGIIRLLSKIHLNHLHLNQQIDSLKQQVYQLVPDISALRFFSIGIHLFPTLIGTTLTYLIILYQFQITEKKQV